MNKIYICQYHIKRVITRNWLTLRSLTGHDEIYRADCQEGQAGTRWCYFPQVDYLFLQISLSPDLKAFQKIELGLFRWSRIISHIETQLIMDFNNIFKIHTQYQQLYKCLKYWRLKPNQVCTSNQHLNEKGVGKYFSDCVSVLMNFHNVFVSPFF